MRKHVYQRNGRKPDTLLAGIKAERYCAKIYERLSSQAMKNEGGAREEYKLAACALAKLDSLFTSSRPRTGATIWAPCVLG